MLCRLLPELLLRLLRRRPSPSAPASPLPDVLRCRLPLEPPVLTPPPLMVNAAIARPTAPLSSSQLASRMASMAEW
jgi:hypothetical protein